MSRIDFVYDRKAEILYHLKRGPVRVSIITLESLWGAGWAYGIEVALKIPLDSMTVTWAGDAKRELEIIY